MFCVSTSFLQHWQPPPSLPPGVRPSETVCCVRGALDEVIYTEQADGTVVESERISLCAGSPLAVAQIPLGAWHTVDNRKEGTIIVESKDGDYEPMKPEDVIMSIPKE